MRKYIKYIILAVSIVMLPLLTQATQCSKCSKDKDCHHHEICDFTFVSEPQFPGRICILAVPYETGIYTIQNNTPVPVEINYIRIQTLSDDTVADTGAVAAGSAPTNSCVVGGYLASGATCNIQVTIHSIATGYLDRILQVGIDTRQVEIDSSPITAHLDRDCTPPPTPTPPPSPTGTPTFTPPPFPTDLVNGTILGKDDVFDQPGNAAVNPPALGSTTVNGYVDRSNVALPSIKIKESNGSIHGFNPLLITGQNDGNDTANNTRLAAWSYYLGLKGMSCGNQTGNGSLPQDFGGMTLTPGVYCFAHDAKLNGTLTLDNGTIPSDIAFFTFIIPEKLSVGDGALVVLKNGIPNDNVNWAIGSDLGIGKNSILHGNIDINGTMTFGQSVVLGGRAWSLQGDSKFDQDHIDPTLQ